MKIKELRGMTEEDLNKKKVELKKELIKLNSQVASGTTPKSPTQIRQFKRTIAKILTILNERKLKNKDKEGVKKDE